MIIPTVCLRRISRSTYVYQGQSSQGSLRLAPVSPEQGMKWISFLGLKPTFFRNGTNFSLHSSYLQEVGGTFIDTVCLFCIWSIWKAKFKQLIQEPGQAGLNSHVFEPSWHILLTVSLTSLNSSSPWGRPFCWWGRSGAWLLPSWPAWRARVFDPPSRSPSRTHLSGQRSPNEQTDQQQQLSQHDSVMGKTPKNTIQKTLSTQPKCLYTETF